MQLPKRAMFGAAVLAAAAVALPARAIEPDAAGWYETGSAVYRTKVALVSIDVYRIRHATKALPKSPTRQAIVALEAPKRFTITMLRDVDRARIVDAIRDEIEANGYHDRAKIDRFVSAFRGDLAKGTVVTVDWDPAAKATWLRVSGGGSSSVGGIDLMHAVWSGWFGEHAKLADDLLANLR